MEQTLASVAWATLRGKRHWSTTQAQWVLVELKRSGLSTRSFASKYKVGLKRIYYWRARLGGQGSSKEPTRLVEVQVPLPSARVEPSIPTATRIEIALLSGRRLGVSESIDLGRLGALVALLEQR